LQKYKILKGYVQNTYRYHPSTALLYLLLFIFAGAIVSTLIGVGIGIALYGTKILNFAYSGFQQLNIEQLNFISISQIVSSLGTFVIPALLLNKLERKHAPYFSWRMPDQWQLIGVAVLFMIGATPFFEWTISLNEQLKLPDFLSGVENWMKMKEEEAGRLTEALLSRAGLSGLFINLFMIGALAAIGEELLFRGCLQTIFLRWLSNHHLAIWLAAFIFSAIHFQFYGFLPRMLIGAVCGYFYFWSRNIWVPIVTHFFNNASAILVSFFLKKMGKPVDYLDGKFYPWFIYVLSFLIGFVLLQYFRKQSRKKE